MVSAPGTQASLLGDEFGGYEVQSLIGRGATGTVYLARDIALGRQVALKVLLGSTARNRAMVRGFHREAQAAAPLRHPNIVRVFSAGIASGTPYIAMEYVPGEPLDRFLRRKGYISWQSALYVGGQIADALRCAHEAGIIHRDVKPANVLLDRQGRARLTDFGIARMKSAERAGSDSTGVVGTPHYMSPEQLAGGEVSYSSDLYSLGVVMYQMMAGQLPFQAESPHALVKQIVSDPAPRLTKVRPGTPDDVARLVAHLLEKEPQRRPTSARHVRQTIDRLLSEDGGRSAIPEALAYYVREQASDPPLRVVTPSPKDKTTPHGAIPGVGSAPRLRGQARRWGLAIAACAVLLASACVIASQSRDRAERPANPPPALREFSVQSMPNGVIVGALPAPGFQVERLGWIGDGHTLVAYARGKRGTLAQGSAGLFGFDVDERRCFSIFAPSGHDLPPVGASAQMPTPVALTSSLRHAGPTRTATLLLHHPSTQMESVLLAQRWNEASPSREPMLSLPTRSDPTFTAPWSPPFHAVMRPDARAVCVLVERAGGANYLSEHSISSGIAERAGTVLTGPGKRIVGETLQYTAAGDRIAYMREDSGGKRELWIVAPESDAPNGALLAVGYLDNSYAISADGRRIAVAMQTNAESPPTLCVLDTRDGAVVARLGTGTVGHDAWLLDGNGFVAAMPSGKGENQLFLIDATDTSAPLQWTDLPGGVGPYTAVSADGAWAAVARDDAGGPQIVVAPIQGHKERIAAVRSGLPIGPPTSSAKANKAL
ncbi:MAG: hypothetical protein AMXMBFR4_03760 [Candidatus Hydrogenedentota bacterium]